VLNTRSTGAEVAGEQKTFSECTQVFNCWVSRSPDYGEIDMNCLEPDQGTNKPFVTQLLLDGA